MWKDYLFSNQLEYIRYACMLQDATLQYAKLLQSCPTLWDPTDCSPPGSSVHGILQATILEWVAMSSSRGSYQPRDRTQVSHILGGFFTIWATREAQEYCMVAYPFSRVSSQSKDWTGVSCIAGRFSTSWAMREVPFTLYLLKFLYHKFSYQGSLQISNPWHI